MKLRSRTLVFATAGLLMFGLTLMGQAPASDWISQIDVLGLNPFKLSFQLTNHGSETLDRVSGQAVLSDQFGQPIETIAISPFSLMPSQSIPTVATSRWGFQRMGVYLLEIALDVGSGVLISNSLAFRILPVRLPLAAPVQAFGEGLRTLYQEPVNWGLQRISAPDAWTVTHGRNDIVSSAKTGPNPKYGLRIKPGCPPEYKKIWSILKKIILIMDLEESQTS